MPWTDCCRTKISIVYTFFEPELPSEVPVQTIPRPTSVPTPVNPSLPKTSTGKSGSKGSRFKKQRSLSTLVKRANIGIVRAWRPTLMRDKMSLHEGSSVLDLKGDNYFSCAVGRKRSSARYLLNSSDQCLPAQKMKQCLSIQKVSTASPLRKRSSASELRRWRTNC
ncbi:alpha,alpha-trehalose-phosphate synthase [UDP-forming] 1-like [Rosa rugosa]|uniref:alpha,alpha-trehalose-phosphate synthase [UDP-forming] 1-like n=1 Tax=Rosa rugosa TaxID=74645 RepID=UPI002B4103E9|nr:alpha,alpha-trehalose-phosphate synthase [UDP-forming] 1-like [Rosa rugosa]